jgi:AcrR family transcriptional regulator
VVELTDLYRRFATENPQLMRVMFSQPFAAFDPGPDEARAGGEIRELIVGRIRRAVDAGALEGDETDIAHGLLAVMVGLGDAEAASRLGRSKASVDRRWDQTVRALLRGHGPSAAAP